MITIRRYHGLVLTTLLTFRDAYTHRHLVPFYFSFKIRSATKKDSYRPFIFTENRPTSALYPNWRYLCIYLDVLGRFDRDFF